MLNEMPPNLVLILSIKAAEQKTMYKKKLTKTMKKNKLTYEHFISMALSQVQIYYKNFTLFSIVKIGISYLI